MKRLSSTDSLAALMSMCPTTTDEQSPGGNNNHVYTREFQPMLDGLDEEGCVEESGHILEKKRRLSVDQVKALEKNFEVENKLEPERKVKLAQELGLQPRQIAVWFQNRRARWKTKQLERDYGVLKVNYESLKHNFESLQHDNDSLLKEIRDLKSKLHGDQNSTKSSHTVKEEEMMASENNEKMAKELMIKPQVECVAKCDAPTELNFESFDQNNSNNNGVATTAATFFPDFKDGSSDSDSSAILNEDNNSPNAAISSSSDGVLIHSHQFMPTSMNCFQFSSSSTNSKDIPGDAQKAYQPLFVKIEEHNFFNGDESCNFFSDDQAPSLQWYCHDQWN